MAYGSSWARARARARFRATASNYIAAVAMLDHEPIAAGWGSNLSLLSDLSHTIFTLRRLNHSWNSPIPFLYLFFFVTSVAYGSRGQGIRSEPQVRFMLQTVAMSDP